MELIHCIYSSVAADKDLSEEALKSILEQSRHNNSKADITGMLLYESGTFFQVLEGDKADVNDVFQKIKKDARHSRVVKFIDKPITERSFGDWTMGYPRVSKDELDKIEGLNDFFLEGNSLLELGSNRAEILRKAFQKGRWWDS